MSVAEEPLTPDLVRVLEARHHDPSSVLGVHSLEPGSAEGPAQADCMVRVFLPHALRVELTELGVPMQRRAQTGLFELAVQRDRLPRHYRLTWHDTRGLTRTIRDPYSFEPQIDDFDLHLLGEGKHWHAYRFLGANPRRVDGIDGVLFGVWAPSAERASVIGEFNAWDGRVHPMRARGGSGIWELFIPELEAGALYKFELRTPAGHILVKTDPYGKQFEHRPGTAARIAREPAFTWDDAAWMNQRHEDRWLREAMSVYEVHLGSWQRAADGGFLNYRVLADALVPYVGELGFTHVELLPVTEHPLDASWGYQTTGYFAPTSRYGDPDDFRYFVDRCHRAGIGVILDWAPGHFPRDETALARFDGTALYEHADPRKGEHRDWGTLIFNYGRNEVRNFLLSSAVYWLEEFHVDGFRVDAVASMLYLDYSRDADDWIPNQYGGNENLEAIDFLRELNAVVHGQFPGAIVVAEESTAWPQVTRPTYVGGLGFSLKWNMGWMNDTLRYMSKDPIHRHFHHNDLTFGLLYAFHENFVLPLSHDEVVHGKGSLIGRMPGDDWQRFANLRLLYTFMFTYPGKKLLFMGGEFGQWSEWSSERALPWDHLDYPPHQGVRALVGDLARLYRNLPALYEQDLAPQGFAWLDCHDAVNSTLSYRRHSTTQQVYVVLNFTPVVRHGFRLGVAEPGEYSELLNSDSHYYWGSNVGNAGRLASEPVAAMNQPNSIVVSLPPLAGLVFMRR